MNKSALTKHQIYNDLKGYDIDFSCLNEFKKEAWKHVDQEFIDE